MANPTTTTAPRKPLIFADNPFDDERLDDLQFQDTHWDGSYVPGYSETRHENELRVKRGQKPIETPRLQWVRISKTGGEDVTAGDEAMVNWMKLGYRACGLDDLEAYGWKMPPTAHLAADGTIRRGDQALFIVSAKRAAYNHRLDREKRHASKGQIPESRSGEVYPVEEERTDFSGSLNEISELEDNLPQM